MNGALLLILTLIGLLALYWVLFGQWKYNKMMGIGTYKYSVDQLKVIAENQKKKPVKKS